MLSRCFTARRYWHCFCHQNGAKSDKADSFAKNSRLCWLTVTANLRYRNVLGAFGFTIVNEDGSNFLEGHASSNLSGEIQAPPCFQTVNSVQNELSAVIYSTGRSGSRSHASSRNNLYRYSPW